MAGSDISGDSDRSGNSRKANQRGAARLAAVQALYQMELAGTGLNEILAQFDSHWLKGDMEDVQYRPAEAAYFRDIVGGVVREQSSQRGRGGIRLRHRARLAGDPGRDRDCHGRGETTPAPL